MAKRNYGPHTLDKDSFKYFFSDVLIGAGDGKRLVMRVFPASDTFVYILTIAGNETRYPTFDEAITAYNGE